MTTIAASHVNLRLHSQLLKQHPGNNAESTVVTLLCNVVGPETQTDFQDFETSKWDNEGLVADEVVPGCKN